MLAIVPELGVSGDHETNGLVSETVYIESVPEVLESVRFVEGLSMLEKLLTVVIMPEYKGGQEGRKGRNQNMPDFRHLAMYVAKFCQLCERCCIGGMSCLLMYQLRC